MFIHSFFLFFFLVLNQFELKKTQVSAYVLSYSLSEYSLREKKN